MKQFISLSILSIALTAVPLMAKENVHHLDSMIYWSPDNATYREKVTYGYTQEGILLNDTTWGSHDFGSWNIGFRHERIYNAAGQMTQYISYNARISNTFYATNKTVYEYDSLGRITLVAEYKFIPTSIFDYSVGEWVPDNHMDSTEYVGQWEYVTSYHAKNRAWKENSRVGQRYDAERHLLEEVTMEWNEEEWKAQTVSHYYYDESWRETGGSVYYVNASGEEFLRDTSEYSYSDTEYGRLVRCVTDRLEADTFIHSIMKEWDYNFDGQLTRNETFRWNDNQWQSYMLSEYVFDEDGLLMYKIAEGYKTEYTYYDQTDLKWREILSISRGDSWMEQQRYYFFYSGIEAIEPDIDNLVKSVETISEEFAQPVHAVPYNVLGQPVDENYKGIVIQNGRKKVQ